MPASIWHCLLFSTPAKLFPSLFCVSFAAGWVAGLRWRSTDRDATASKARSWATQTGAFTAAVACLAAHMAAPHRFTSLTAVIYLVLSLLPCAMFATLGAGLAGRLFKTGPTAMASRTPWGPVPFLANALLPTVAAMVWPLGFVWGKLATAPKPAQLAVKFSTRDAPAPRYTEVNGFPEADAWQLSMTEQEKFSGIDARSPCAFSADETQIAYVARHPSGLKLQTRHLHEAGPDHTVPVQDTVHAMAWSPDASKVILVTSTNGALWVCELDKGSGIQLPIPRLHANDQYRLHWWKPEMVLVFSRRDKPRLLSLDTLRLTEADRYASWVVLSDEEKEKLTRAADTPALRAPPKVRYRLLNFGDGTPTALVAEQIGPPFSRVLTRASGGQVSAFSNGDGSLLFLREGDTLRQLSMGLRDSPALRYTAEAGEELPSIEPLKAALTALSVRAAITQPIVNPLNGKTVAGIMARIKGYARLLSVAGKDCTVWIEQEREPVRAGDVLMSLSAIQGGREYSASREWWAVLKSG